MDDLLSREECRIFIRTLDNPKEIKHVDRGSTASYDRNIWISKPFAATIFARIKHLLPPEIAAVAHCNDHFRFSKYHEGQKFDIHRDGVNQDDTGARTRYTVNIFLCDDFEGGETDFLDDSMNLAFRAHPKPGRGAIFDRDMLHRGNKVTKGFKYLLRTDVMEP